MSNIKLDLSKFKHIKSDQHHATLAHDQGHILTIAIKALGPENQEQLKAMANGGKVESNDHLASGSKQGVSTQGEDVRSKDNRSAKAEAKGRMDLERHIKPKIQHLAEGGVCMNASCKSYGQHHPNCRCGGGQMAEGGNIESFCSKDRHHFSNCEYLNEGGGVDASYDNVKASVISAANAPIHNNTIKDRVTPEQDQQKRAAQDASNEHYRKENPVKSEPEPSDEGYKTYAAGGKVAEQPKEPPKSENTLDYKKLRREYIEKNGRRYYAEGDPEIQPNVSDQPPMGIRADAPEIPQDAESVVNQAIPQAVPQQQEEAPIDQGQPAEQPQAPQQAATAPQGQAQTPAAPQGPNPNSDDPLERFTAYKQAHINSLTEQDKAFENDLQNGHIEPQTFNQLFAKKGTGEKIGSLFGLLLSGFGSGLSHQSNAIMDMMKKEMDNDFQAQIHSKANAQNMLRLSQQHVMNQANVKNLNAQGDALASATARTKLNIAMLHKMVQTTKDMPEGPDKQKALQALAMLSAGVQNDNFMINDRLATTSALNQVSKPFDNNSGATSEEQFQNQQRGRQVLGGPLKDLSSYDNDHHFPGIPGQSTIPWTDAKREEASSGIDFDKKLKRFINFTKTHSGDLSPSDNKAGKTMAAELQGAYRQATHGGVYKEGEQNFISKLIDEDPTKFFNKVRVLPSLNALANEHKSRMDNLFKNQGYPGYPGANQSQAKVVPGVTHELQTINGKQYYVPKK